MKRSYYPRKLKKKIKKENKKLIQRYPFLMPKNVWTGKDVENFDYTWNEFESGMPKGWWKRFGKVLCEDLREVLLKYDYLNEYFPVQVKEKYGGLRIYDNGTPKEWDQHLRAWELISEHTCAICGAFPVPMRHDGWIIPECDRCFRQRLEERFKKNDDVETIEKFAVKVTEEWDGRMPEYVFTRIYDKDGDHLEEVNMLPFYDKIGWKYTEKDIVLREELLRKISGSEAETKR